MRQAIPRAYSPLQAEDLRCPDCLALCLVFVLPLSYICLTFVLPLSYLVSCCEFHLSHLSLQVPVEQETLTLSFMEEEEEDRAPGGFQARKVILAHLWLKIFVSADNRHFSRTSCSTSRTVSATRRQGSQCTSPRRRSSRRRRWWGGRRCSLPYSALSKLAQTPRQNELLKQ